MLDEDRNRLETPYAADKGAAVGLSKALGVDVPEIRELEREIRCDLSPGTGGIGWWQDHLDAQRNCLIGPYLAQVVWSVNYNLLESGLHRIELREWGFKEEKMMERSVAVIEGRFRSGMPRPKCAADELPQPMVDLHTGGLLRAVSSALDCLGGAIIGVAGLPKPLLRASWQGAVQTLEKLTKAEGSPSSLLVNLHDSLLDRLGSAGPAGWAAWTLDYRNMLVHRARRFEGRQMIPRPTILGPRGEHILRTELVRHPLRDPGWCEIDSWRNSSVPGVLEEDADRTLSSLCESAVDLIRGTASDLIELWRTRRAAPDLIRQPASQWPNVELPESTGFPGFSPGSRPWVAHAMSASPDSVEALRAGQVFDDRRPDRWEQDDR